MHAPPPRTQKRWTFRGVPLRPFWLLATALLLVVLAGMAIQRARDLPVVTAQSFALDAAHRGLWEQQGGDWQIDNGEAHNRSGERGAKLLAGSKDWQDYTVRADLRPSREVGDMGVAIRSNYEHRGLDTYTGYYVALRPSDGTMLIGRSDFAWMEARPIPVPDGVQVSTWYRFQVTAVGCKIAASVQNLDTLHTAYIAFEDRYCFKSGRFALRSVDSGGAWRNISVAPATLADYQALARHAGPVERLVVPDGPPWLTPWRAGLLFAASLALVLLGQLMYFRVQRWKRDAIDEERERLAHAIHDTMAQSFAGVGYQIQGIRNSVMRSNRSDAPVLAEQLSVAYQLVRRCHEDASRTISMLSSGVSPTPQRLLKDLEETAKGIAGEIQTRTELSGSLPTLDLRVADALLHVGREAISNAISHGSPSSLSITLSCSEARVSLAVEDNGCGFQASPHLSGLGIAGMQKRAREIAGQLIIRSNPGMGTCVTVEAALRPGRGRRFSPRKARLDTRPQLKV